VHQAGAAVRRDVVGDADVVASRMSTRVERTAYVVCSSAVPGSARDLDVLAEDAQQRLGDDQAPRRRGARRRR
jgi:hypothetical protein